MTTDITELAQSLKAAAEKSGIEQWVNNHGEVNTADYEVDGGVFIDHICDCEIIGTESPRAELIALANPANILALVEALEKAQQRIAELDIKNCELDSLTQRWAVERAENADRIAELESRTVTVKLPEPPGPMSVGARTVYFGIVADVVSAFQYGLTAAGIKVEVE
ncbi:ead/Ea22-like family protein [Klebsiella variicola]